MAVRCRRLLLFASMAMAVRLAGAQEIHGTVEADGFVAVFSDAIEGAPSGPFSGFLSLNKSSAEIPVKGTAQSSPKRVQITMKVKYSAVPEDWFNRSRISDLDFRLHGKIAGSRNVDWAGTKSYRQIEVETRDNGASDFVRLNSVALTPLTATDIAAYGKVSILNPLSFPLKLASTDFHASVKGRAVGSGSTKSMTLQPGWNALSVPIDLDQKEILAAAGAALKSPGGLQSRLQGTLVVHTQAGDITAPLDLAGGVSAPKSK
jgi:hypothetical protein